MRAMSSRQTAPRATPWTLPASRIQWGTRVMIQLELESPPDVVSLLFTGGLHGRDTQTVQPREGRRVAATPAGARRVRGTRTMNPRRRCWRQRQPRCQVTGASGQRRVRQAPSYPEAAASDRHAMPPELVPLRRLSPLPPNWQRAPMVRLHQVAEFVQQPIVDRPGGHLQQPDIERDHAARAGAAPAGAHAPHHSGSGRPGQLRTCAACACASAS
jgi:hypothetical protein